MAKAIAFAMRCPFNCTRRASKARPAPAPPMAGASHPPGQALALLGLGLKCLRWTCRARAGKRGAFPDPPERAPP